jgi:hypothetical protein
MKNEEEHKPSKLMNRIEPRKDITYCAGSDICKIKNQCMRSQHHYQFDPMYDYSRISAVECIDQGNYLFWSIDEEPG